MFYGKATETAIAALSCLAEVYDGGATRLSAAEIAQARGLTQPFLSKVLSTIAQAGLIHGSRGPGGGFTLTRHPKEVTLFDAFTLFERQEDLDRCPFGGGVCGSGESCPLHDRLATVRAAMDGVLHETTFDVFRRSKGKSTWRLPGTE